MADKLATSRGKRSKSAPTTDRKIARLEKEKREYASIIDELPIGVVGFDYENTCVFMNRSAQTYLGIDARRVQRQPLADLVRHEEVRALLEDAIELGRDGYPTARTIDFAGRTLEIRSTIPTDIERISSVVFTVQDVTWRKRADDQKDEFLSLVSHELRTPLTVIKGYLDILDRGMMGSLTDQQSETTQVMLEQCQTLEKLIRDLIRLRSLARGPENTSPGPVALKPLLNQLAGDIGPAVEDAKMTLTLDIDNGSLWCWCDACQLYDVLQQIIENGVKFAHSGKTLRLSAKELDPAALPPVERRVIDRELPPHARWVCISVADRGPGIPPDKIKTVFERFEQGEEHLTRNVKGLGIGLALVERVVDLNGGTLWIDSELGRGTKISFTLPLIQPLARS